MQAEVRGAVSLSLRRVRARCWTVRDAGSEVTSFLLCTSTDATHPAWTPGLLLTRPSPVEWGWGEPRVSGQAKPCFWAPHSVWREDTGVIL